jgi:hypothetical protein
MSRENFNQNIKNKNRMKLIRDYFRIETQSKLSELLELPIYKIKDVESGKVKISVEIALLLEEKFNLNFKWLLTGEGEMFDNTICGSSKPIINQNIVVDSFCESVKMLTLIYDKNRNLFETVVKYLKQAVGMLDIEEGLKDSDKKQ